MLDLFAGEVFGYGALGQGGNFGVRGEAQADELIDGQGVDEVELVFGEKVGEAELLFEADDAVLIFESIAAREAGQDEENDGHDDPPEVAVSEEGPGVDGRVDCEAEIQEEKRKDEEVKGRIEARVVLEGLRLSHSSDDSAEAV